MKKSFCLGIAIFLLSMFGHTAPESDSMQLQRFRISADRPFSVYQAYRMQITAVVIAVCIFIIIVVILHLRVFKRKQFRMDSEMQKEISRNKERYRVIFENAAEGIIITETGNSRFLYVNSAICRMLGYTADELGALGIEDIHPPEALPEIAEAIRKQTVTGTTPANNIPCLRKDGTLINADISSAAAVIDGKECSIGFFTDSTARHEAARALAESEAKFRNIVQSSPMGMHFYRLEPDNRLVFMGANPAADKLLSIDHSVFVGKTIEEAFPSLADTEIPDRYREVARGADTWFNEQIDYKDHRITGAFEVYAFRTSSGYMAAAFLEITERKLIEQSLRESEETFRNLVENSPNMVFINQGGRILYASPLCERVLGYSIKHLTSPEFHFIELIAPASVPLVKAAFERHMQGEEVEPYEYGLITAAGRELTVINNSKIINYHGKQAILGVVTDITERKKAEAALRESEIRYRSFLQNFQGIAYRANLPDSNVLFFHGAVQEVTGYSEAEFINGSPRWDQIILPEDFADMGEEWQRLAVEPEYATEREYRIRRKDGKTVWIHELVQNVCEKPGAPTYVQGALYDVTDRKNAENLIRASLREKETLLQEVHHRVKNNLQVISSLLSLQSQYVTDKRDLEIFNDSRSRIRSMALIHEQLYRADSFASVDFNDYISNIARELYRSYGVDPDRVILKTDIGNVSIGLNQAIPCGLIVNELISNALKYAFPEDKRDGEIAVTVNTRPAEKGTRTILMSVSDNGRGLPADVKLDNSGSLGLYLVRLLTEEQLEGSLEVDRKNGTVFTITFTVPAHG